MDVRAGEGGALLLSFAYFFLLLCSYYILRPLRDAWGIEGGTDDLPWLFTATFVTMLAVTPLYGAVVARCRRRAIVPTVYRFFGLNLLAFYALLHFDAPRVPLGHAFFVWISVYNLFVVSIFWSVMADLFASEQGRRLFGFIAVGGSLGALAGPLLARQLAEPLGTGNLLLLSAVLLEACTQCVARLLRLGEPRDAATADGAARAAAGDAEGADAPVGGSILNGMWLVLRDAYMRRIAAQVLCLTTTATFLYLLQARIVSDTVAGTGARTAAFANIDLVVNAMVFGLQLGVTAPLLRHAGLGTVLRILPVLTAAGSLLLAAQPTLLVLTLFQGLRRAVQYALYRPARELLLTVVGRERKYASKGFIDTVVYRGGDWASAQLFAGLELVGFKLAGLALAGLPVAAGWWLLCGSLARRQRELEQARQPAPSPSPVAATFEASSPIGTVRSFPKGPRS